MITSLLVGAFAVLSSVRLLSSDLTDPTEWMLLALTLVMLAPVAFVGGRALAQEIDIAAGRSALAELAALASLGIIGVLMAGRAAFALEHRSSSVMLVLGLAWAVALVWGARRCLRGRRLLPQELAAWIEPRDPRVWAAIATVAGVGLLMFFPPHFFHGDQLAWSLVLAVAALFVHLRRRAASPRWTGLAIDAAVVALLIMVITDVSGHQEYLRPEAYRVELESTPITSHVYGLLHRIDEGFYLGPLNDMRHGRSLLVDTSSQYGVGVFYFLTGFFQIAPLGYGALGLLSGFLTALQFALAYGVLRLAGVARTIAIPAVIAAVSGLALGSVGSFNDFPSKGGLRFGIPWLIVALALLTAHQPHRRRGLWAAAIVLVAIASVWSFDTFAYAGATYAAAAGLDAASRERGQRLRTLVKYAVASLAACALAHVILAVSTRVFAGSWPAWSTYLAYLSAYSSEGTLTQVTRPWPTALPVLLVHLASLLCLAALVVRRHELFHARRPALMAIAALNGFGVASYTYWVSNSTQFTLYYIGLPVLAVVTLWLALTFDARARVPRVLRLTALVTAAWLAAMVTISGADDAKNKWRRTALAHVIPGTAAERSLPAAVSRLWNNPVSDARSVPAQRLLERHFPSGAPVLTLMEADLTVETLARSDRINVLPIGQPLQDNLVVEHTEPKVIATVDALRPGTLMLTQPAAWDAPERPIGIVGGNGLLRIQRVALDRIRSRFVLQIIDREKPGLAIVRLVSRVAAGDPGVTSPEGRRLR